MSTKPKKTKKSTLDIAHEILNDMREIKTKLFWLQNSLDKQEMKISQNRTTSLMLCTLIIFCMIALLIIYYGSQMTTDQDTNTSAEDTCTDNSISIQELQNKILQLNTSMMHLNQSKARMNSTIYSLSKMAEIEPKKVSPYRRGPMYQDEYLPILAKWIIYYGVKLFGQAAGALCLGLLWITDREYWFNVVGIIVCSHLCIEILYFDFMRDIVLIMAYLIIECIFMLLLYGFPNENPYYVLGSFIMAQMNVLYWRLWKGDNDIHLVFMAFLTAFSTIESYYKEKWDYLYWQRKYGYRLKMVTMWILAVSCLCNAGIVVHEIYRMWCLIP